ncbi:MAG: hypothetical protein ACO1Q7_10610 [Gemmatimonas sp.]
MLSSRKIVPAAVILFAAACAESPTQSSDESFLSSAFSSIPAGYDEVQTTFADAADSTAIGGRGKPWMPDRMGGRGRGGPGGPGGPGLGSHMGGGLAPGSLGGIGVGHGIGHGPFGDVGRDSSCTFSAATGDVTCAPAARNGITITRIATYKTAAGMAQAKPDSTTNSARVRLTVSGTRTRRDSATAVIASSSDRTVTGLAKGSTSRTVNGVSSGSENTTGTNASGAFSSVRIASDTVKSLVIPVEDGKPTYPKSGSVVRYSKVTATVAGGAAQVSERRETITYNGTATATLVIVDNGVTKNCTVALPHGRPSCQ